MPTINDLGKSVKSKYPGQYDDLDDAEVGHRVQTKYPGSYDDYSGIDSPVDMTPRNYGSDTTGQGFLANALKTIRGTPEAMISGDVVSGPIQAIGKSMQDYLANPTLHNSIRAIPGVGMAEDLLMQPYRTAASGDIPGAWGNAADLAMQALAMRASGTKYPEPYQTYPGEELNTKTNIPTIPKGAIEATHLVPVKGGIMRLAARGYNGLANFINGAPSVVSTKDLAFPSEGPQVYNLKALREMSQHDIPGQASPLQFTGSMGIGTQSGFGTSPISMHPVTTGADIPSHIPDYTYPIGPVQYPVKPSLSPSGTMGIGPQAGFGITDLRAPVEVGGAHIPDYIAPHVLTTEELGTVTLPDWYPKPESGVSHRSQISPIASDQELIDIARGQGLKTPIGKWKPEERATIEKIAKAIKASPLPDLTGGQALTGPVGTGNVSSIGSVLGHVDDATAKIHNMYDYIVTQRPDLTPSILEKEYANTDKGVKLAEDATNWARAQGRTEGALGNPKGKYQSFDIVNTRRGGKGTAQEVIDLMRGQSGDPAHPRPEHYGVAPASPYASRITPLQ